MKGSRRCRSCSREDSSAFRCNRARIRSRRTFSKHLKNLGLDSHTAQDGRPLTVWAGIAESKFGLPIKRKKRERCILNFEGP